MNQRTFAFVAGTIFAIVALAHLLRLIAGWPVVLNTWPVPMWASGVAVLVAGYLAFAAFRSVS